MYLKEKYVTSTVAMTTRPGISCVMYICTYFFQECFHDSPFFNNRLSSIKDSHEYQSGIQTHKSITK